MENNREEPRKKYDPIWIDCCYKRLLEPTYKKDELLLIFDTPPSSEVIRGIKETLKASGIDPETIEIRHCEYCDSPFPLKYIQLWKAKGIHTVISGEGPVRPVVAPTTSTHGEQYSLNFYNSIPFRNENYEPKEPRKGAGPNGEKEKIIIAVLDTGIDPKLISQDYLWKKPEQERQDCYKEAVHGWNFVDNCPHIYDDHPGKHGSLVSQYIINEFEHQSSRNRLELMTLKTHDKEGIGDLFGIMCALHYAIAKGAKIINASWGFYSYFEEPIPYLRELITEILPKAGILFVAAAGNSTVEDDKRARIILWKEQGIQIDDVLLRNLEINNFYPAYLSNDKNSIVTVTTTNGEVISPTQNYSEIHVDLGVLADEPKTMKFGSPFVESPVEFPISGSSFAAAIGSGRIGANCDIGLLSPGLDKTLLMQQLESAAAGRSSGIIDIKPALETEFIKKGRCTIRTL